MLCFFRLVVLLSLSGIMLSACNSIKSYSKPYAKNIVFKNIRGKSGPLFGLKSKIAVYKVDSSCHTHYQGGVEVRRAAVKIGLPKNHYSFLVIQFQTEHLQGTSSSLDYGGYLMPRAGSQYYIYMVYHKNKYDLIVKEIRETGYNKSLELLPQVRCRVKKQYFNPNKQPPVRPLKDSDFNYIARIPKKSK